MLAQDMWNTDWESLMLCCRREDVLKQEIKDMEARCQRAEQRHADLVATMPSATQPLLRQLDALQVCHLVDLWSPCQI